MEKKIIVLIIVGIVLLTCVILGVVFINKNNTENFDMSGKKRLANNLEENENIKVVTTIANENVISPNDKKEESQEYVIRENNGYIAIYRVDEDKKEVLIEITPIVIAYLPDIDRIELSKGIRVFGKEQLSLRLEDYE